MKRHTASNDSQRNVKRVRLPPDTSGGSRSRIASAKDAERVDANPPYLQLLRAIQNKHEATDEARNCVLYWMRMEDLRVFDNRALARASERAKKLKIPLVAMFLHSPEDYVAHDRGTRKIDFVLRNLKTVHTSLDRLNIPFVVLSHSLRRTLPEKVVSLASEWGAEALYANIEHEVDELRRDLRIIDLLSTLSVHCEFVHDRCVVPPGKLETKQGKQYTVFSPWLKQWSEYVTNHPDVLACAPDPAANDVSIRYGTLSTLFNIPLSDALTGFECEDANEMEEYWPAGTDAALNIANRFLQDAPEEEQLGAVNPIQASSHTSDSRKTPSRITSYDNNRDRADLNGTSRVSPYLAAGVVPARALIRTCMEHSGVKKINANRGTGPGVWSMEIAWRDFYTHVMAAFPRVSMGRPFLEKYSNVRWETNDEHLQAWKDGMTGVPIVDAGMRQLKKHGWMHNRGALLKYHLLELRMIVAMFLSKDLMIDWRLGELHFSKMLIDADLASNNGGWQWSASTGTDAQPYFRVFNPYLQAEKADPTGKFIKHYVPELRSLKGKALYYPSAHLDTIAFERLGYPKPIVLHNEVKDRAIARYKNPGEE